MKPLKFIILVLLLAARCFGELKSDLEINRTFTLSGDVTPSQITSDQDDYNPTNANKATRLRISSDTSRTLNGLVAQPNGKHIIFRNVGSANIVFANQAASSSAANRFDLGSDFTLVPSAGCILQYDGTSSRWAMVASSRPPGGGGGGDGTVTNTGGDLTSNSPVLGAGGADTKTVAWMTTNGSGKIIIGVAGSIVGSIDMKNGTSGTITIHPPTGALSTADITLPIGTVTLATLGGAESLTNKKLGSLTTNGNVKTSGSDGTLIVDTVAYAPLASPTLTGTPAAPTATAATNSTQLSTTAYADDAAFLAKYNPQSGDYTLVLSDRFKTLLMTSGSANALTIPPNSDVAFPVGTRIPGWTTGAGATTITAGAGVTIQGRDSAFTSAGQQAAWSFEKTATNTWKVTGDLVP